MSAQAVVILGMHRSYTTLLAEWLHRNGINMDRPATDSSPLREDVEILQLHEEVLTAHGMNWLNARKPLADPDGAFAQRASRLWEARMSEGLPWGWKDPRTCIVYDLLYARRTPPPRLIAVYRNPLEVVTSLYQRELQRRTRRHRLGRYFPPVMSWHFHRMRQRYLNLYLNCSNYYNLCCLQILEQTPPEGRIVMHGADLLPNEKKLREKIETVWRIPLGGVGFAGLRAPSTIGQPIASSQLRADLWTESQRLMRRWRRLALEV